MMLIYYVCCSIPRYVIEIKVVSGGVLSTYQRFCRGEQPNKGFEMTMKDRIDDEQDGIGKVKSHFLDSGAFTQWTESMKYAEDTGKDRWSFYRTKRFRQYMDDYATFVKKYQVAIDLCANVDAIGNPELTYRNQKYLEKRGLRPVPVVHYKTDLKWLKRYMDEGYELIGLGGLVGSIKERSCRRWIDRCFDLVCDTPDRTPMVKLHGFGVTSYRILIRYPWWSVDSVTWAKAGGFGVIMVPHKRRGKFVFNTHPYNIAISVESKRKEVAGQHYETLSRAERLVVDEWLDLIGIPLGRMEDGEVVEFGVSTRHTERRAANLIFFEKLCEWLPDYPWPFGGASATFGFGVGV